MLTVTQLVKKFPSFYWTPRFIIMIIAACHWSLYWVTWIQPTPNTMEHSPSWEAKSSASQEIRHLPWNPKVDYCVQKSPHLVPTPSHMHLVHTFPSYFSKIHSNIALPNGLFPSHFLTKTLHAFFHLSHECHIICPSHPPWQWPK